MKRCEKNVIFGDFFATDYQAFIAFFTIKFAFLIFFAVTLQSISLQTLGENQRLLGVPDKTCKQCFGGESGGNRAVYAAKRHPSARFGERDSFRSIGGLSRVYRTFVGLFHSSLACDQWTIWHKSGQFGTTGSQVGRPLNAKQHSCRHGTDLALGIVNTFNNVSLPGEQNTYCNRLRNNAKCLTSGSIP